MCLAQRLRYQDLPEDKLGCWIARDSGLMPYYSSACCDISETKAQVRKAYITEYQTKYTDRKCWNFTACPAENYALQQLVENDDGFLMKPLICKAYR